MLEFDEDSGEWIDSEYTDNSNPDDLVDLTGGDSSSSGENTTQTFDDGSTLTTDSSGNVVGFTEATDTATGSSSGGFSKVLSDFANKAGTQAFNALKSTFVKPDGSVNWAGMATAAAGLYSYMSDDSKPSGGYNKAVPKLTASREKIDYVDPNRRPGEAGRQYFTDMKYDGTSGEAQKQGILAAYKPAPAAVNPYAGQMAMKFNPTDTAPVAAPAQEAASQVANYLPVPEAKGFEMAQGGIASLAKGGRYLSGATDGMADKIRTNIDGKQPAALSHGEFVIPADVVSHLGNGNSEAGANKLYEMMSRIRKARTGNPKQGKQIDANKYMPGGLATYAAGGHVARFDAGGTVASSGTTNTAAATGTPPDVSKSSTLSPWVGDYVTDTLGQGAAAADKGYQAYTGPLTAGASDLQQQAFAGSSEIAKGGFTPTQFTSGTFGAQQAQQYMNPYLKSVLDPQMAEMKRQADIARLSDAERLTKAGAYGGSRQAIMESEGRRNLLGKQTEALGQGYANAYDKAMGQFNTEQGRGLETQKATEASRVYSADFGLKSLADLARQGEIQRGITSEGIAADKKQFEEQRDYPMQAAQYKLNLLQGLPIGSSTTSSDAGALSDLTSQISGLMGLYKQLEKLGVTTPATTPATTPPATTP